MIYVQVDSFMKHVPNMITNSWWKSAAAARVISGAEDFVQLFKDLAKLYRPVGTFLFAQSHVTDGSLRTSATVVPSGDAASILVNLPEVRRSGWLRVPSFSSAELAFAEARVKDHSVTGYWRIANALCEGNEREFASFAENPPSGCPRDSQLHEKAIVNQLDSQITVAVPALQHSFDVASGEEVSLKPLDSYRKITVSSTSLGDTKWYITVPSDGGLLIHKSNILGDVARTYSVTDGGLEMGPIVSPHGDPHGGYVDQLAAHLCHRYPEGATVGRVGKP